MEKKYSVLILIADVGGGHMAPAKAIKQVFEEKYPEYSVRILDLYAVTDVAPFNTSEASYTLFTHNYTLQAVNDFVTRLLNTSLCFRLFDSYVKSRLFNPTKAVINTLKPDIVLTNHPIVTGVVSHVKEKVGGFYSVAQVTDLDVFFRAAADRNADMVISPSEMSTKWLVKWGVDPKRIETGLFSLRPHLAKARPKSEIYADLGLSAQEKTVVVMGGGVGFNKYLLDAVDNLIEQSDYQVVLMTGKLDKLADILDIKYQGNSKVVVQRFTREIQDIFAIADVIVAKPGMSIMLESEIFEKPTIITRWVAIQEKGNVNYMVKNPKFRYLGNNWNQLPQEVDELLEMDTSQQTSRRSFDETGRIVDRIVSKFTDQLKVD